MIFRDQDSSRARLSAIKIAFWLILALPVVFSFTFVALWGESPIWQFSIARSVAVTFSALLFIGAYFGGYPDHSKEACA